MGWPTELYELTPRDVQSVRWEPVLLADEVSGAAGALNIDFPEVPQDKFRWITNIMINANVGSGETITNVSLQLRFFSGVNARIHRLINRSSLQLPQYQIEEFPNHTPWPSGWNMRIRVLFSPGTATNTLSASIGAIQTPRGNVAL